MVMVQWQFYDVLVNASIALEVGIGGTDLRMWLMKSSGVVERSRRKVKVSFIWFGWYTDV